MNETNQTTNPCMRCGQACGAGRALLCGACWSGMPAELHAEFGVATSRKGRDAVRRKVKKLVRKERGGMRAEDFWLGFTAANIETE